MNTFQKPLKVLLVSSPFIYFPNFAEKNAASQKHSAGMNGGYYKKLFGKLNYARPPLGLCYLGGELKKAFHKEVTVRLVDGSLHSFEYIVQFSRDYKPHIIGISASTANFPAAEQLAAILGKLLPEALFVLGGPHAGVLPGNGFPAFDLVVQGEGEKAFAHIVQGFLENGKNHDFIFPGVVSKEHPGSASVPERITDLDALPFPDRSLLSQTGYFHSYPYPTRNRRFTTMFTTRGCSFNCTYCGSDKLFGRPKRNFSLIRVEAELNEIVNRYDNSLVFFDDDEFLLDKKRLEAICCMILKNRFPVKWICHGRPEGVDPALMRLMKDSGCVEIQVGVESGCKEILRAMNRNYDLDTVHRFFETTRKTGINTWATYIVGYPGETEKSLQQTLELAMKTDPTYASFIMLLPFPGAQVYDELETAGRIRTYEWSGYSWHTNEPVFIHDRLSAGQLVNYRKKMLKAFYLRPGKMARIILHTLLSGKINVMARNLLAWASLAFPPSPDNNRKPGTTGSEES